MALPISKTDGTIRFDDYVDYLAKRRAEVGNLDVPRNAGNRRTESKKALLRAIEDLGGKW